jgi:hypothetical protein
VAAQEKLSQATFRIEQLKAYKTPLQPVEREVTNELRAAELPRPDQKTAAWQERNTWFGTDSEMTAAALGLHQKLERERGKAYVGSDEYWATIDSTMKRRFPEYFGEVQDASKTDTKAAPVVATATRTTGPRKVRLTTSQLALAKKFGLTPEQYARELVKLG